MALEKYFYFILPKVWEGINTYYCFLEIVQSFKGQAVPVYNLDVYISKVSEVRIDFISMTNMEGLKTFLKREVMYFLEKWSPEISCLEGESMYVRSRELFVVGRQGHLCYLFS